MTTLDHVTPQSLAALEAEVHRDLERINYPPDNWTPPDDPDRVDVLVVGGGQMGLSASFALNRLGIRRHLVIDEAPEGREGPWVTYARMKTLRSPKHLVGPAQDVPSLTFRAFWEAQHGQKGWERLGKIPTATWQDYLVWFRRVLDLPVRHGIRLLGLAPDGDGVAVTVEGPDGRESIRARRVVLATGRDGLGGPNLPDWLPQGDPRFRHSTEPIDFHAYAGRPLAVVGASASAFDNVAAALEAGAAPVHMLMRRERLPTLNRFKGMVHAGFTHGFPALPPRLKLAFLKTAFSEGVNPPTESVERLMPHAAFHFHPATAVRGVDASGDTVRLELGDQSINVDLVILGTGFRVDLAARPELSALAGKVRLWRDGQLSPQELGAFADHPDLSEDFAFIPRAGGDAWVGRVHAFNIGAMASLGLLSGDIPGVGDGALRLGRGIARSLFLEDAERHMDCIARYDDHEITGSELSDAAARARSSALERA
jgi:hypothetical protein